MVKSYRKYLSEIWKGRSRFKLPGGNATGRHFCNPRAQLSGNVGVFVRSTEIPCSEGLSLRATDTAELKVCMESR